MGLAQDVDQSLAVFLSVRREPNAVVGRSKGRQQLEPRPYERRDDCSAFRLRVRSLEPERNASRVHPATVTSAEIATSGASCHE